MTKTLTVTREGTLTNVRDGQGNFTRTPDTTFTVVVRAVAPNLGDESEGDAGTRVITGKRIYGYKDLVLLPTDRITIDGVSGWQVEGEPGLWESAFGTSRGGTEFVVRRSS